MSNHVLQRCLAPIAADLAHENVTDIVVNECGHVGVRKSGIWNFRKEPDFTFNNMDAASIITGYLARKDFDRVHPYLNATLPGGHRFQSVHPPGTKPDRILWAIRRPPSTPRKHTDPDFEDLFTETNSAITRRQRSLGDLVELYRTKQWTNFFPACRHSGMSMGFVGPTGSGKTDLLRRMIQINRDGVRYVTIETDDEFGDAAVGNCARLFFDESQMTADEAVRIALRLIPKEIWYQEVRGAEAYPLMRAFQTGHDGGGTSWHGAEGREPEALANMARNHPATRDMKQDEIMDLIRNAIDVIAYCNYDGEFRVSSVRFIAAERAGSLQ